MAAIFVALAPNLSAIAALDSGLPRVDLAVPLSCPSPLSTANPGSSHPGGTPKPPSPHPRHNQTNCPHEYQIEPRMPALHTAAWLRQTTRSGALPLMTYRVEGWGGEGVITGGRGGG